MFRFHVQLAKAHLRYPREFAVVLFMVHSSNAVGFVGSYTFLSIPSLPLHTPWKPGWNQGYDCNDLYKTTIIRYGMIILLTPWLLTRLWEFIDTQHRNTTCDRRPSVVLRCFKQWVTNLCSKDFCHILKRFRSFKIADITFTWTNSMCKYSVSSERQEKTTVVVITIVTSSIMFFSLYIARW